MYRRILVPLDGSELAERILPHVEAIGKGTAAEIILLRVTNPMHAGPAAEAPAEARKWLDDDRARASQYLDRVAARLRATGLATKLDVVVGEPAVEVLSVAEKENADLIALMSHGVTGFSHFDRGSVAEKVLKASLRPVLMARAFRAVLTHLDDQEVWAVKR